jgi:hypothetical protein
MLPAMLLGSCIDSFIAYRTSPEAAAVVEQRAALNSPDFGAFA